MHRHRTVVILLVAVALVVWLGARAQEHPKSEHPKKEHPAAAKPVSTADLEAAIRAHIDGTAKKNNGSFPVKDDVLKKTWQLKLVRVHTDRLTQLDDTTFFACVDFSAADGTLVDVDFFLKGKEGKLEVTDTSVHKINGVARYLYQQKGKFWERVKAG